MKRVVILLFLYFLSQEKAQSQVLVPAGNKAANIVFVNIGLEPSVIATVGYLHGINKMTEEKGFYLGTSIKFAPLIIKNNAWRVNLIQTFTFPYSAKWEGLVSNELFMANNENRAGTMKGMGFELKTAVITTGDLWKKGLEAGWQYIAFTRIIHSDVTKDLYRDYLSDSIPTNGPVDGWYGSAGSRFRIGFLMNRRIPPAANIQLNVGTLFSIQKQKVAFSFPYAQVPFYINTQFSYAF